ncbi:MAG: type VI secretion system tip protein VgrG [Sandaracinaceae bacterium]|nr:type VI secretion system tip protein VgrG [Sandaracinaceae bacterium]
MNQVEAILLVDPMPAAPWRVLGATVVSALNEPYLIRLDIESEIPFADPQLLLGSSAALVLRRDLQDNVYGGIVSSVRAHHWHTRAVRAHVVVEPALAALRAGRDSRIFQEKSVPTVLQEVLEEGLAPYGRQVEIKVQRTYPPREYTVQYQESDFAFVHRLMAEEGIVYAFEEGEDGVEKLVLIDAPEQHPLVEGAPILEYSIAGHEGGLLAHEHVRVFEPVAKVVGTEVATRHFDWTHPSAKIDGYAAGEEEGEVPHGASFGPPRESYQHDEPLTLHDYALSYRAHDVVDQQRVRREVQARDALTFEGESSVRALRAGARFDLNGHAHIELNAAYVVTAISHFVGSHAHEPGHERHGHYHNRFTAVAADVPYRPERVHPRPRIRGIQTAIVTGPAGEEIHTDEHGRVKVQFHWDRLGEMDDKTTCWIRCMQTWAGPGWGAFVLPRVGMEVVVSFIDGDVDRPLVTGCVYDGDRATPYELPAKKMVSTFKTNSYPGGDGYNELRFDDSKSEEEIWLHGEKDWNTVIEHDLTREVRHDEHQKVTRHRTRKVGSNETVTVGHNRSKTVGANEKLVVGASRTRMVGGDESVTIGANQSLAVVKDQTTKIGEHRSVKVGLTHELTAGVSLELRCGESRILMEADGKITVEGTELHFTATGEVFVKGSLIHLN